MDSLSCSQHSDLNVMILHNALNSMTDAFEVTQEIPTFLVSAFHEASHLPLIHL